MVFKEAFKVTPDTKEGAKMEVNTNAFTVGGHLETSAAEKIRLIQKNLDYMQKKLKRPLNKDEIKVAWLAIEREMEDVRVPKTVADVMRENPRLSKSEAVDRALGDILTSVEDFVRTRLAKVIEIVDDESWTGSVSKDEAGSILRDLEKSRDKNAMLTDAEVQAFKDRYANPSLLEQGAREIAGGSSMRRAADEAMRMH